MPDATRPERCTLMNPQTGERIACQFNPGQLQERYKVKWAHLAPVGAGSEIVHYTGTENGRWSMDFYLDAIGTGIDIMHFRQFLLAFTRPATRAMPSCPPALVLVWPAFVTLTARVLELAFTFEQFAPTGAPTVYVANAQLEALEVDHG